MAPGAEKQTMLSAYFYRAFLTLLESNEKSDIRGRNCLTVPKMANIMPEGSAALSSVLSAWAATLVVVALVQMRLM
jgi:hypothetical protein